MASQEDSSEALDEAALHDATEATVSNAIPIAPDGDLIISVQNDGKAESYHFRVSTNRLKEASPYFVNLLDPDRFKEGATVNDTHKALLESYDKLSLAKDAELPSITIYDLGRISKVSSIRPIASDFLSVLHDIDVFTKQPPLVNVANLAIVADRFDALPFFRKYVRQRELLRTIDARTKARGSLTEERIRQRLMLGVMLDYKPWVAPYSKRLIINGSDRWQAAIGEITSHPLWRNLPYRIEGTELTTDMH